MPKSISLQYPLSSKMMFSGLMSLCIMFIECRCARPFMRQRIINPDLSSLYLRPPNWSELSGSGDSVDHHHSLAPLSCTGSCDLESQLTHLRRSWISLRLTGYWFAAVVSSPSWLTPLPSSLECELLTSLSLQICDQIVYEQLSKRGRTRLFQWPWRTCSPPWYLYHFPIAPDAEGCFAWLEFPMDNKITFNMGGIASIKFLY